MKAESLFPPVVTIPEVAVCLAGCKFVERVGVSEFIRFTEHFGLKPIDLIGCGSRNRGEIMVRQKWSKRHIDLILLTGQSLRDYSLSMRNSLNALEAIANGAPYGVLHNAKYGEIHYPLGRMGKGGFGFLHIVEQRIKKDGATLDEAIEIALRVGIAAEIGEETKREKNTRHLDIYGYRAIIALMNDRVSIITGYKISADESKAAYPVSSDSHSRRSTRAGENGAAPENKAGGIEGAKQPSSSLQRNPLVREEDVVAALENKADAQDGANQRSSIATQSQPHVSSETILSALKEKLAQMRGEVNPETTFLLSDFAFNECFEEAVKAQAKSADSERFRCKLQAVEAEDTEEGAKVVAEYEFFREERFFVLKFRLVRSDNVFEFHLTKVF